MLLGCSILDRTPPTIDLSLPTGPVRAKLTISPVVFDEAPGVGLVDVFLDDEFVAGTGTVWNVDTTKLSDGPHAVRVSAQDTARAANGSKWEGTFISDNTAPVVLAEPASAKQGQTLVVWATINEPVRHPMAAFSDRRVPLFEVGDRWRALIGMDLREELGVRKLVIEAVDDAGNSALAEIAITVVKGDFTSGGTIRLSGDQIEARKDEKAKAKTREERESAYAHLEPKQLWTEAFQVPIAARVTSPYGSYRTYSDGKKSYHSGMDLAKSKGSPIGSAASGKVLVAGWQAIFGNVVIVHHGQGVTTSYNHLDEVKVSVGDTVSRGDIVGLLGNTGQSTGPHLHWGVTVAGNAVDPAQWLDPDFWKQIE